MHCFRRSSALVNTVFLVQKKHKASCKKYKALILKYKPYILKYMACIFAVYKYMKKNVLQKPFFEAFRRGKMPYV